MIDDPTINEAIDLAEQLLDEVTPPAGRLHLTTLSHDYIRRGHLRR
jgi:hypothetical protein